MEDLPTCERKHLRTCFSSTLIYLSFPPAQLQVDWDFYYTFRIISMNKKIKLTVLLNDNCFHLILLTFFKYLSEQFHPISLASFSISGHLFSFILSSSWFFFGFFIRWFSFRWIFLSLLSSAFQKKRPQLQPRLERFEARREKNSRTRAKAAWVTFSLLGHNSTPWTTKHWKTV